MAYNTKPIIKDVDGNPISQYYNPLTDKYEEVEGTQGGNKVVLYNSDGTVNDVSLLPIVEKLNQLTGTMVDESTRKSSEVTRQTQEGTRQSQEATRVSAESGRKTQETKRATDETARKLSESTRVTQELGRVDVEATRVASERTRVSEEDVRLASEIARVSSEKVRVSKETTRVGSEDIRLASELDRVSKETTRVSNENKRLSGEVTRVANEDTRKSNESTRVSNEALREINKGIVDGWISNPSQFNGKDIEYNWQGTSLGVRVVGSPTYSYVDLKGETGSIDNLAASNIQSALGFLPKDYVAGENITIDDNVINAEGEEITLESVVQALGYTPLKELDIENKVDKIEGKGLSEKDFTTLLKNKLDGIEAGANKYTHPSGTNPHGATKSDVGLGNVDNIKQMPISGGILENYREKLVTLSGTSTTIDLSLANVFTHSLTGNTTYTITNAVSGQAHSFTLIITQTATARTLTFPASVKWQGGKITDMSTANKTYVLTFMTVDGGSSWLGMFGGEF